MPRNPCITLSVRSTYPATAPFRKLKGPYADPGVALDEIRDVRAEAEPLLLRVFATGVSRRDRFHLAGDWFCDTGGDPPRKLPVRPWRFSPAATAWSRGKPWVEAWETCPEARWMLHEIATHVDLGALGAATCACAQYAIGRVPPEESRPLRLLESLQAWHRRKISEADLLASKEDARVYQEEVAAGRAGAEPRDGDAWRYGAIYATQALIFAAQAALHMPTVAPLVAEYAARAMEQERATAASLSELADRIRRSVPTPSALRAARG